MMRIKEGFVLRKICGEMIVVGEGLAQVNFNKVVCLNDTAAFLWTSCEGVDFDPDYMADKLVETYDVPRDTALSDTRKITDKWFETGIMER